MEGLKEIIDDQLKVGQSIQDKYRNFKKDSISRKTEAYCQERLVQLSQLVAILDNNHKHILELLTESTEEHPYIRDKYFESVSKIAKAYDKVLIDLINQHVERTEAQKKDADLAKANELKLEDDRVATATAEMARLATEIESEVPIRELIPALHINVSEMSTIKRQIAAMASLKRLLGALESDSSVSRSRAYWEHNLTTIETYWRDIMSTHHIILGFSNYYDYKLVEFNELEDLYQSAAILIKENLTVYATGRLESALQLPKITLPIFDGSYLQWKPFQDLYTQLIHNRTMAPAEKFFYLRANLKGEPHHLIKHLLATDANYTTAWNILIDRYDNPRLLVTAQLNQLLSQTTIQSESAVGIKRMHDLSKECLQGINNLGIDTTTWSPLILHILVQKLDKDSRRLYEQSLDLPRQLQSLEEFFKFLECRFQTIESACIKDDRRKHAVLTTSKADYTSNKCPVCKSTDHKIYKCAEFLKLSTDDRSKSCKRHQLCINCLKHGHHLKTCSSRGCLKCNAKHNTLLHSTNSYTQHAKGSQSTAVDVQRGDKPTVMRASGSDKKNGGQILLATAVINVSTSSGKQLPCRALLDTGSQLHFISSRLAQELGVQRRRVDLEINGIGNAATSAKFSTDVTISSRVTQFSTNLEALILHKISDYQPGESIEISNWNLPKNITLADPYFYKSQRIDMLLGADLVFELLEGERSKLSNQLPILQNTKLGWIVAGKIYKASTNSTYSCHIVSKAQPSLAQLDKQVKKFWEAEHFDTQPRQMTKEEFMCEQHFTENTIRDSTGTFVVRLPFKANPDALGYSSQLAYKRMQNLENKFSKAGDFKLEYSKFIKEYEDLNHMTLIKRADLPVKNYYLPHHGVCKPDSTTTKLRVVFDASAKTTSGVSLNQLLMVGPTVQSDLFSIVLRFRIHQHVFTADISKMYRQILVAPEDRNYQLILWRSNTNDVANTYQLNTVTYGTSAAPFLATRCLVELATLNEVDHPEAAKILKRDMYVDDCLSGANTEDEAAMLLQRLVNLLKSGNFELRKFCSNRSSILKGIPNEHREKVFTFEQRDAIKTLGLIWLPTEDVFQFNFIPSERRQITKRTILSDVARIFDPLGLIGPTVVLDSSERAYGACLYLRSTDAFGQVKVSLLCSKSRVTPLTFTTIAKLELCGALLMAELVERIMQILPIEINEIRYYTDSTTVLAWLRSPSYTWNTYVANRVARVQELSRIQQWHHITGTNNPADLLSRGSFINHLVQSSVWFNGPEFLRNSTISMKEEYTIPIDVPERRAQKSAFAASVDHQNLSFIDTINHKNSFQYVQRLISYIFRFARNCKSSMGLRSTGVLSVAELETGLVGLVKDAQRSAFKRQYQQLSSNQILDGKDQYAALSLFLDPTNDIIRVGGRLKHSSLPEESKCQILLPKSHTISKLILTDLHFKNMHAAPQSLVAISRQKYWIIDVKRMATHIVHSCVRCFKVKPRSIEQLMGQLPHERVTPSRPFNTTGIDFCGPVYVHHKIRGKRATKAYISVFVCFTTRAIHLELVSDLTSDAFLNALKRFIARRGLCSTICCDNGTNFVGARNELKDIATLIFSERMQTQLSRFCQNEKIEWKHIPPRAPHFGGLWEAAVKAAKYHLVRVVGLAHLTYEELQTVIVQIEAILNSRPITALSSDPNDVEALTPGHFLIGRPLTATPELDVTKENVSRLNRFRQIQHIHQHFWRRWSMEYLNQLQVKGKWKDVKNNIKSGSLVLLKDSNSPPLRWQLGRITDTVKGPDNLVRVVNIKTKTGMLKRSIHHICPLPQDDDAATLSKNLDSSVTETQIADQQTNISKRVLRSGKKLNLMSTLLTVLLIICPSTRSLPSQTQKDINITEFDNNMGLYFENVGTVKTINSKWDIITYYNLTTYWQELGGLRRFNESVNQFCDKLEPTLLYCRAIAKEVSHRIEIIEQNNILLHKFNDHKGRKVRSPFDFIGSLSNGLFGILDQNYAKHIEGEITQVNSDNEYLLQLIKNQTSISETTINVLKKTTNDINAQFAVISAALHATTVYMRNESAKHELRDNFKSLITYLSLILTSYENTQKNIMDVVLDLHHSRVNPQLITPDQMQTQLSLIRNSIPSALTLPTTDLLQLYKLITVRTRIVENSIIFKMEIPLPTNEYFQLFNVVPVPIIRQNQSFLVQTTSKYLAITLLRDKYYPITTDELLKCSSIESSLWLCNSLHPIFNQESNVSKCEVSLLQHKRGLLSDCKLHLDRSLQHWIKLNNPNSWIFSIGQQDCTANIVCEDTVNPVILKGNGLLRLRASCKLKINAMTLNTETLRISYTHLSFIPSSNFSIWVIPDARNEPTNTSMNQIKLDSKDLDEISTSIKQLKEKELSFNHHDVHHYGISYFIIFIIIVLLALYLWHKRKQHSRQPPIPQPRTTHRLQRGARETTRASSVFKINESPII